MIISQVPSRLVSTCATHWLQHEFAPPQRTIGNMHRTWFVHSLSSVSWMGTVTKPFTLLQNQQLKWLSGTWTWETQSCACLQFILLTTYFDLGIKVQLLGSFPFFHDILQKPGYKTGQVDFLCWLCVLPKGSLSKTRERSIRCLKLSQLCKSILCLDQFKSFVKH